MSLRIFLQILIGVAGYAVWGLMAWADPVLRPDFLKFNIAMAVGTIGLVLRDMKPTYAPPIDKQSGRAIPALLAIIGLAMLLLLGGCSSLQFAGNASYSLKPFIVDAEAGTTVCCEVLIMDGKERVSLELRVTKQGDGYTVDLKEQGVQAFQGQAIAAGATQAALDAAAKSAVSAALAPLIPALLPAAGAALASPGLGAAAVGAVGVVATEKALK